MNILNKKSVLFFFFLIVLFQMLDIATTLQGVLLFGISAEGNIFMRFLFENSGLYVWLLLKLVAVPFMVSGLFNYYISKKENKDIQRYFLVFNYIVIFFYCFIVTNNIYQITR